MKVGMKSVGLLLTIVFLGSVATLVGQEGTIAATSVRVIAQAQGVEQKKAEAEALRASEADRLLKEGDRQVGQQQYPEAFNTYQKSLELYRAIGDRKGEGYVLRGIGNVYLRQADYGKAIDYQRQALAIAREIKNQDLEARSLHNIGFVYEQLKESGEAISFYQQSLFISRHFKNFKMIILTSKNLATIYSSTNQYEKALGVYQQGLEGAKVSGDFNKQLEFLNLIGDIYQDSLKNYQKAIEVSQQALLIARGIKSPDAEALALDSLTRAYISLSDSQKTIEFAQQSLIISQQIKNKLIESRALAFLGDTYAALNENQKAIEFAQGALVITREFKNPKVDALALDTLTRAYSSLGDSQKTIEFAQQSLAVSRQIKHQLIESRALAFLGDAYISSQGYKKAIEAAQQALVIAREIKNSEAEALALDALTRAYGYLDNPHKTIEFAQQSLVASQRIKNRFFEIRALVFLSSAYSISGRLNNYQKALESAQKILTITQESKNRELEYLATYNLAGVYNTFSEDKQVVEYAQKALLIAQALKKSKFEGQSLVLLGKAYHSLDEHDKAIEMAQKGLMIAQKLNDRNLEAKALHTLGSSYDSLNKYQKALEFTQKSLAIAQEIKSPSEEFMALITLAGIYGKLGDYNQFNEYAQQALSLARNIKTTPLLEAYALLIHSINSFVQRDYQKTVQSLQQGLSISDTVTIPNIKSKLKSVNLLLLSASYGGLKDYSKAVELAHQAQESSDVEIQSIALNLLGDIYRKTGQREKAIDAYGKSLSLDKEDANTHAGIARIYRDLNLPTTAISHYKQAINQIEDTRKEIVGLPKDLQKSFLKAFRGLDNVRNADIYRELADLLISQGSFGEAQQVMELLKVQELNDFSKKTRSPIPLSTIELSPTEKAILADYGGLIAFIEKVTNCQAKQCADLDKLIEQRNILNKAFIARMQGIEQQAVEARKGGIIIRKDDFTEQAEKIVAQPKTLLIYPLVLKDRVQVLYTATGKVYGATECPIGQDQLWQATKAFHDELRTPNSLDQAKTKGKTLYDCLVAPLEGVIKANGIEHLVFAPDLATNYIPLGALYDGKQFLIQRFTIANIVDARSTDTQTTLPQNPQVLALGMSTGTTKFSPLPNVPPELASIVKAVTPKSQGVFPGIEMLNANFTQTGFAKNLRQGNFAILHFATHAEFKPTNPIDSFLLLGDGKELTIPDIQNLDGLGKVHLVVLSACQTALNDAKGGVEVRAISSYFLSRAKTVVASLWNVNDASTALMMQQFYKHIADGKTKAQALQQVQQDFIQGKLTAKNADELDRAKARPYIPGQPPVDSFAHPYYWAPFILIGNSL